MSHWPQACRRGLRGEAQACHGGLRGWNVWQRSRRLQACHGGLQLTLLLQACPRGLQLLGLLVWRLGSVPSQPLLSPSCAHCLRILGGKCCPPNLDRRLRPVVPGKSHKRHMVVRPDCLIAQVLVQPRGVREDARGFLVRVPKRALIDSDHVHSRVQREPHISLEQPHK